MPRAGRRFAAWRATTLSARIVVMGCYATRAPSELAALPGVVEVVTDKRELPDLLGRFGRRGCSHRHLAVRQSTSRLPESAGRLLAALQLLHHSPRAASRDQSPADRRSWTKSDDCSTTAIANSCSPACTWGTTAWNRIAASRNPTGCDCRTWCAKLPDIDGDFRLRLSSLEATEVTRELVETVAEFPDKICPHFHICLQSGSDRILRRMRRRWGIRMFVDRCRFVQDLLPLPALTTDVIVGFPGESEADFRGHVSAWCARLASRRSTSSRSARATAHRPPRCRTRCPQSEKRIAVDA